MSGNGLESRPLTHLERLYYGSVIFWSVLPIYLGCMSLFGRWSDALRAVGRLLSMPAAIIADVGSAADGAARMTLVVSPLALTVLFVIGMVSQLTSYQPRTPIPVAVCIFVTGVWATLFGVLLLQALS